jgi:hypothetical protein
MVTSININNLTRTDIINLLIVRRGYTRYLEIGVEAGENWNAVQCQTKHGVDPNSPVATFKISSDEFFHMLDPDYKYDIIFVDGLHTEDQSGKDMVNAVNHLSDNGIVVVHDCNPPTKWHQRPYEEAKGSNFRLWNGEVWRSFVNLRSSRPFLAMQVVDTDWGCGLIEKAKDQDITPRPWESSLQLPDQVTYETFDINRNHWLGLISPKDFIDRYIGARV